VRLERKAERMRHEIYSNLTRWQRVQLARHPRRPYTWITCSTLTTEWTELHGDRGYADDASIVGGVARMNGALSSSWDTRRGGTPRKTSLRTSACPIPRGIGKRFASSSWPSASRSPSSPWWTRRGPIPGWAPKNGGSPKPSPRNSGRWPRSDATVSVIVGEGGREERWALAVTRPRVHAREPNLLRDLSGGVRGHSLKTRPSPGGAEVMKLTARDVLAQA